MEREKMIEEIENILFEYDAHEESAPWVHIKYAHKIIDAILPDGAMILTKEELAEERKRTVEYEKDLEGKNFAYIYDIKIYERKENCGYGHTGLILAKSEEEARKKIIEEYVWRKSQQLTSLEVEKTNFGLFETWNYSFDVEVEE